MKAIRLSIACSALLLALPAGAVVTATWGVETYPQWDAGDATSAFITSAGELRPGWDIKRTSLEGDAVWSSLRLADGSVLLGSDAGGAIYKLSGDAVSRLVTLPGAIAVVALAQTSDGAVWAGAMPGNKLWKVDVAAGKASPTGPLGKDKDVETVWSLAAIGNTVYAGTGPSGKLFAVTGGAAREVFATDDKRITALTVASDGAVWLGTSDRALVFRFDPRLGEARAMADFAGNEVSSLAAFPGGVIAAANDLVEQPPPTAKSPAQVEAAEKPNAAKGQVAKPPEVGSKPGADKDPLPVTDLGRKGAKKGKGALFRIGKDGRLDQLHALTRPTSPRSRSAPTARSTPGPPTRAGSTWSTPTTRSPPRSTSTSARCRSCGSITACCRSRPTTRRRRTARPAGPRRRATSATCSTPRRCRGSAS